MQRCVRLCALILLPGFVLPVLAFSAQEPQAPDQQQTSTSSAPQSQTSAHRVHVKKGDRDDINAIGKRKIVNMDWYSLDKEVVMGDEQARRFEQNVRLVVDPAITEYIERLTQKLVQNSDAQVAVTIKVIDSTDNDETDSFSVAGGHVYVTSGLILDCENEAELAGMIAHGIAHVAARHVTRMLTREQLANILSTPIVTPASNQQNKVQAGIGVPLTMPKFRRAFELEADYFGIQYLYKSGYDPAAFVVHLQKEEARNKTRPGALSPKFSTHPQPAERIAAAKNEIARILPPSDYLIVNTKEFDSIKSTLAARENSRSKDSQPPK